MKIKNGIGIAALAVIALVGLVGCDDGSLVGSGDVPILQPEGDDPTVESPLDGSEDVDAAAEPSKFIKKRKPCSDEWCKKKVALPTTPDATPKVEITAESCEISSDQLCKDSRIEHPENLTVVTWSLKNVSAAFMKILPYEDEGNPFAYTAFIGDEDSPYLGAKAEHTDDGDLFTIADDLLISPLQAFNALASDIKNGISADAAALPFSYCASDPLYDAASCYKNGSSSLNYLYVFFPLRKNETSRSGKWLMSIDDDEDGFAAYYRDMLADGFHSTKVINKFVPAN